MGFSPEQAEKRFGYGLSPDIAPVASVRAMLDGVTGEDAMARLFPIPGFRYIQDISVINRRFNKHARENRGTPEGEESYKKVRKLDRDLRLERTRWFAQTQLRCINTRDAFRERLVAFWGDHFTAQGKGAVFRLGASLYLEEAVRPHVAGRFADMLVACVTHPLMLHYLDQDGSAGPNSKVAKRSKRKRGLNENLAREVLELHTLGVGGPYNQRDVRELAKLFTGMGLSSDYGFRFRGAAAEPGAETVLGQTYSEKPTMGSIVSVLHDLAAHPATAAHVARKLVVHFVADTPPQALVDQVTDAFMQSDGDLMTINAALLDHPAAWSQPATNMRPPVEFMGAALRALAVPAAAFAPLAQKDTVTMFYEPLALMGQSWQKPDGPDGWPEEDSAWVTPQALATRLEWAIKVPARLMRELPDPRQFVYDALGADVPKSVAFAANAAETRAEAIGLVLASPAFQRR